MNNIDKTIGKLNRRSTTKLFDPSFCIESDIAKKIEEIFNLAPTSFGLQPFKLVKTSEKERALIQEIAWGQKQVADCTLMYILAIEKNIETVLKRYERLQVNIRKITTVKATEYSQFIRDFMFYRSLTDNNFYESWAARQMYLALGFFLSQAVMLNIDTAPLEGFDEKKLDSILNLKKFDICSKVLLCIGRRSVLDEYPKLAKIRKSHSDLVLINSLEED